MMHVAASSATFVLATSIFAVIAARRAARCGDRFNRGLVCLYAASALAVILASQAPMDTAAIVACAALTVSAATDCASGYVYDVVALAAAAWVAIVAIASGTLIPAACGAVIAGSASLAIHAATRRRGLGLGDVKLFALAGAAAGGGAALAVVAAAFVGAACVYGPLLALRRVQRSKAVPFAPFIALAALGVRMALA